MIFSIFLCTIMVLSSVLLWTRIPYCIPRAINLVLAATFVMLIVTSCNGISEKRLNKDKIYSGKEAEVKTEVVRKEALDTTSSISNSAELIFKNAEETLKKETLTESGVILQNEIKTESKNIENKVPELNRSVEQLAGILREELEKVKKQNTLILNEAERMQKEFNKTQEESAQEREELLAKNKELEEKLEQLHRSFLYKVMWFSILLVIAGIPIALYINPRLGIGLSIGGLVSSALCIFLIKYLGMIAVGVGIIALFGVIGAVIYFIKKEKTINELVKSFDYQKARPWEPENKEVINLIQSKETKALVEKIKTTE